MQADGYLKQPTTTMSSHQIRAAHNGLHWTIAFGPDGAVVEIDITVGNDLYTLFECTCGATFEDKDEGIAHLEDIDSDESGEEVRVYREVKPRPETAERREQR